MTESDYNAIPAVRWSRLRSLRKSALQYKHDAETEREDAAHFRIGRAIHCYVLEPSEFQKHFVTYTESKTTGEGARKNWQAFQAKCAAEGVTILDAKEHEAAVGAALAILAHPVASEYVAGGVKEHTITWIDSETGMKCKARIDQAHRVLVDIKSAREIGHRMFATVVARLGYFCQLAFYLDGAIANGFEFQEDPVIVAVESSKPHDVAVYKLGESVIDAGRAEYRRLLVRLKECQDRGDWPGIAPDAAIDLVLPPWAYGDGNPLELVFGDEAVSL